MPGTGHTPMTRQEAASPHARTPSPASVRAARRVGGRSEPRLIGRDAAVAHLKSVLASLSSRNGGALLIEGEAGAGKTALARRLADLAHERGVRVRWGAASEAEQCYPLLPFLECLALWDSFVDSERQGIIELLRGNGSTDSDPLTALTGHLTAWLQRLCADSPVILVADNLQWADDVSIELWHRLLPLTELLPLLMVAALRSGRQRPEVAGLAQALEQRGSRLAVPDLDDDAIQELISDHSGAPDNNLVTAVSAAGGNPGFALAIADGWMSRRAGITSEGGDTRIEGDPVSSELADMVLARVRPLSPQAVETVRTAAVLGTEFRVTDLVGLLGRTAGELQDELDELASTGLLELLGDRARFRHRLVTDVLYHNVAEPIRAAIHRLAADISAKTGGAPAATAEHLLRAGGPLEERSAKWLQHSARELIDAAPETAGRLLDRVLGDTLPGQPEHEALALFHIAALIRTRQHIKAESAARTLLASTTDPQTVGECIWLLGHTLQRTGRSHAALEATRDGLARASATEPWQARLHALQAQLHLELGAFTAAKRSANQAVDIATRTSDSRALGDALVVQAAGRRLDADLLDALALAERAEVLLSRDRCHSDARGHALTSILILQSELDLLPQADETVAEIRRVHTLSRRTPMPTMLLGIARLHFRTGRWDEAMAELGPLTKGESGPQGISAESHSLLALISAHRDDRLRCAGYLAATEAQLIESPAGHRHVQHLAMARAVTAEQLGRPQEALAILTEAVEASAAIGSEHLFDALSHLVRLAVAAEDTAVAVRAAARCRGLADEGIAVPYRQHTADYCAGLITADPDGVLRAAEYFHSSGRPLQYAHSLADAAELLAQRGRTDQARSTLSDSVSAYSALGAAWDIRRAESRLRSLGVRCGRHEPRSRPATGWDSLTPRQRTVARMIAGGLSNPAIAAELMISARTVQSHVSHILTKLDLRSRVEIAHAAARQGSDEWSVP
ncbi:helix-turn-helix transcriptional regulator [Streptomyces sp. NPDC054841]